MQTIDILYLYEKAVRELDIACAIKYLAQQQYGLQVEIAQQNYGYESIIKKFWPRVIVLPFCYQERSQNSYLIRFRNSVFFNLTWEQLFYPGNQAAKTPRGQFAVNHVVHHAWSNFYSDLLRQQGVPPQHIFLNGNPAYALYLEPYRRYFKQRMELASEYGLDPRKRWVFFPENYNWAFYSEAMLQQMINDGQASAQVYAMREFSSRSFEAVMRWCEALMDDPGIELIVRPRPATLPDDFRMRVQQVIPSLPERFRIIQAESVREWVMASEVVVSSYSTTLIEAAFVEKRAYMLEPYPLSEALAQEWHQLIPHLTTSAQFLEVCRSTTSLVEDKRLGEWARSTMMANGDPIQNLVDQLGRICQGVVPLPSAPSRASITLLGKYPLPKWLLYELRLWRTRIFLRTPPVILAFYRKLFGRNGSITVDPEYEIDVVSQEEIPRKVQRWKQVLANRVVSKKPT